jgi:hypothetical protein
MLDSFKDQARSLSSPAHDAIEIVPNDGADLQHVTRALYVGGTGNVRVRMASGNTVTFQALAGGIVYPIRAARVLASGTNATGLIGLW